MPPFRRIVFTYFVAAIIAALVAYVRYQWLIMFLAIALLFTAFIFLDHFLKTTADPIPNP